MTRDRLSALQDQFYASLDVHHVPKESVAGSAFDQLCNAIEAAWEERDALKSKVEHGRCLYAGVGRGDCVHAIGLPGVSIDGQHDGPDHTVDAHGKPNGWCWSCWKSYQIDALTAKVAELRR